MSFKSGGNTVVRLTEKSDRVVVQQRPNGGLTLFGPTDTVNLSPVASRHVTIEALGGDDTVLVDSSVKVPLVLDGGAGNDLLVGGAGNDVLLGGAGDDDLQGAGGNDLLEGGSGHDSLYGGLGDDVLYGLGDDDDLSGGDGADYLDGGAGDDLYGGGGGGDILFGGTGEDMALAFPKDKLFDLPNSQRPGRSIRIAGDAAFVERVESDLQAIRAIPLGNELLVALDATGKTLIIEPSNGRGNETMALDAVAAMLRSGEQPGPGSSVVTRYAPRALQVGEGAEAWRLRPPLVGLIHELIHALSHMSGVTRQGDDGLGVTAELSAPDRAGHSAAERDVIGLGSPHSKVARFTENAFRAALGLPRRPEY